MVIYISDVVLYVRHWGGHVFLRWSQWTRKKARIYIVRSDTSVVFSLSALGDLQGSPALMWRCCSSRVFMSRRRPRR